MDYSKLKAFLKADISDEKLATVLSHSSIVDLSEKQRIYNNFYHAYGRACITASIALFLFKNDINNDNVTTVNLINSTRELVIKEVYYNSNLEEFIIKSKCELESEHHDMVCQLFGLVASENNMLAIYQLLYELIDAKIKNATTIDYKSRLLEYATKQKMQIQFIVLSESGPDHRKNFEVKLIVGKKEIIANGKSKKIAEKEASKLFCQRYNVILPTKKVKYNAKIDKLKISSQREKVLLQAAKKLKLTSEELSLEDLDVSFTPKQYANEHNNKNRITIESNSKYSLLGGYILPLYCLEYIKEIKRIDGQFTEFGSELARGESLSQRMIDFYSVLRQSYGSSISLNKYGKMSLSYEAIKAIIGFLSKKTAATCNDRYYKKGYLIFTSFLDSSIVDKHCYISRLQTISQATGGKISYSILQDKDIELNAKEYELQAIFTINDNIYSAKAIGHSSTIAKQKAAEKLYLLLKENGGIFIGADRTKIKHLISAMPKYMNEIMIEGDLDLQEYLISVHGMYLQYSKFYNDEIALLAVKDNSLAIQYVKKQTIPIQIAVIRSKNKQAIDKLIINDEVVWNELIAIYPEYIDKIETPTLSHQRIYNKTILGTNKEARKNASQLGIMPYDEEEFFKSIRKAIEEVELSGKMHSMIIDNKIPTANIINEIVNSINPTMSNIAVGFLFESGLGMLKPTFNLLKQNNIKTTMIVGTLQKYTAIKQNNGYIEQMDYDTAILLNKYIKSDLIELGTYPEAFYHGKYYYFANKNISCVITGSSNISVSGLKINRELNVINIISNNDINRQLYNEWFEELKRDCIYIDYLDISLFLKSEKKSYDEISLTDVKIKIESLTDKQQQERLNMWISKNPYRILKISKETSNAFKSYIVFEYPQYNLSVMESFESENAFYCFNTGDFDSFKNDLKGKNKIQMCMHPLFLKRGYHTSDTFNLMLNINSLF